MKVSELIQILQNAENQGMANSTVYFEIRETGEDTDASYGIDEITVHSGGLDGHVMLTSID